MSRTTFQAPKSESVSALTRAGKIEERGGYRPWCPALPFPGGREKGSGKNIALEPDGSRFGSPSTTNPQ